MSLHFILLSLNTSQIPYQWKPTAYPFENHTLTSPDKILMYKKARWEALNNLDGRMFKVDTSLRCEAPQSSLNPYRQSTYDRNPAFTGTTLLSYPKNVDVVKQLCRFKQGISISNGSYRDRNFMLLTSPSLICGYGVGKTIELLILIKSAHLNINRRMAIRRLWGDNRCWGGRKVRHVFVLGVHKNQSAPSFSQVGKEIEMFGDIIQQQFIDNYYNNTYKLLFGIQWAVSFCPEAKWLMFVDDDFFVNPRLVLSFIDSLDPRLQAKLVAGDLLTKPNVHREKSKWSISKTLYPHEYYPNYVQAGAFFMGSAIAIDIYIGSRFTEYFPFDDVFIGFVLNKLLVAPAHLNGLSMSQPNFRDRRLLNGSLALHGVHSAIRQKWLWSILGLNKMCGATT
ncbi:Hexosyltransferase [Fasciolopsis buskii]|uniref:Hexosyltransferase n=1 Tax=Fasciolopsis buskii TaxID=27845 RepID=A0A8E0VNV6_9TREM|nr:Hexosyltransferase [Fasciolopsis buski]